jgi:hypothetical protein
MPNFISYTTNIPKSYTVFCKTGFPFYVILSIYLATRTDPQRLWLIVSLEVFLCYSKSSAAVYNVQYHNVCLKTSLCLPTE